MPTKTGFVLGNNKMPLKMISMFEKNLTNNYRIIVHVTLMRVPFSKMVENFPIFLYIFKHFCPFSEKITLILSWPCPDNVSFPGYLINKTILCEKKLLR